MAMVLGGGGGGKLEVGTGKGRVEAELRRASTIEWAGISTWQARSAFRAWSVGVDDGPLRAPSRPWLVLLGRPAVGPRAGLVAPVPRAVAKSLRMR